MKIITDPISGSHRIRDHEHLGNFPDKLAVRDAYSKWRDDQRKNSQKEHEHLYSDKKD